MSSLNEGGKKVSGSFSAAGTKIKLVGCALHYAFMRARPIVSCRESETLKTVGEKTSSALKRTGTVIKDTGANMGSKISGAASSLKVSVFTSVRRLQLA